VALSVVAFPDTLSYVPVHQLQEDWLIYDQAYETYVPYLPVRHNGQSVHFFLRREYAPYDLLLWLPHGGSLWVNQRMVQMLPAGRWVALSCEELLRGKREAAFVSIFTQEGTVEQLQTWVAQPSSGVLPFTPSSAVSVLPKQTEASSDISKLFVKKKNVSRLRDVALIGALVFLLAYRGLVAMSPRNMHAFWQTSWMQLRRSLETAQTYSLFSATWLLHLLWLSGLTALLWLLLHPAPYLASNSLLPYSFYLFAWGQVFIRVLAALIAKWLACVLVAYVLSLKERAVLHYFRFLQIFQYLLIVLLVIVFIAFLHYRFDLLQQFRFHALALASVLSSVWVLRQLSVQPDYLSLRGFLYFCATEWIPLFWFLKAVQ